MNDSSVENLLDSVVNGDSSLNKDEKSLCDTVEYLWYKAKSEEWDISEYRNNEVFLRTLLDLSYNIHSPHVDGVRGTRCYRHLVEDLHLLEDE